MPDHQLDAPPVKSLKIEETPLQDQAMALLLAKSSTSPENNSKTQKEEKHSAFAGRLGRFIQRNFSSIDDNGDNSLSHAEVKLFALKSELSAADRELAKFVVNNYDDLNKITDFTDERNWKRDRPNFKLKSELTLNDFAYLRTYTNQYELQKAVQLEKSDGAITDYVYGCTFGTLGGAVIGIAIAGAGACLLRRPGLIGAGLLRLELIPRLAGAAIVAGGVIGLIGGYRLGSYARNQHYMQCENYYDQKNELTKRILDRQSD